MPHQSAQVLLLINSPLLRIMYNYNHLHYNHNGVGSYQINYVLSLEDNFRHFLLNGRNMTNHFHPSPMKNVKVLF